MTFLIIDCLCCLIMNLKSYLRQPSLIIFVIIHDNQTGGEGREGFQNYFVLEKLQCPDCFQNFNLTMGDRMTFDRKREDFLVVLQNCYFVFPYATLISNSKILVLNDKNLRVQNFTILRQEIKIFTEKSSLRRIRLLLLPRVAVGLRKQGTSSRGRVPVSEHRVCVPLARTTPFTGEWRDSSWHESTN